MKPTQVLHDPDSRARPVGLGQSRAGGPEPLILTSGDDLRGVGHLLGEGAGYSASDVLDYLAGAEPSAAA